MSSGLPRKGTPSACAPHAHAPVARRFALALGDDVLRSVQRPVHVDRHFTPPAKAVGGGALESVSRSGKPAQAGGTGTEVGTSGRCAARRASPLPQGRKRGASEKEGGRGLRPCEDRELRFGCPHVVMQLQKSVGGVWSRISSANALQKERSGSSERGPSRRERWRDERQRARRAKRRSQVGLSPAKR
jgi:hypothetical protein